MNIVVCSPLLAPAKGAKPHPDQKPDRQRYTSGERAVNGGPKKAYHEQWQNASKSTAKKQEATKTIALNSSVFFGPQFIWVFSFGPQFIWGFFFGPRFYKKFR